MRASDVFDLLRDGRPRTRAQLAEVTGLARSTVSARLEALMALGLVVPVEGVSTGGRPPALLTFNPGARVVVGVDLGATHARAAIADLDGRVLAERGTALDIAEGPDPVLAWVEQAIRALLAEQRRPLADLAAVGIGLPGPVEHSTGRAINPPIMPGWDRYDVPAAVQRAFAVPVLVDNDVNVMALGEQHAHLRDTTDLVFIKVGTGIGAGIISGGALQRGAQGTAGDLGHVQVARAGEVTCRCGNQGCLEAIAAVPAVAAAVRAAGVEVPGDHDVVALVRAGDQSAVQAVRQAGRDLGEVLATLVNLVNPSSIVIGGSLASAGEGLLAGIREVVYRRSLPLATEHLQITTSRAGERAGVIGAAALAIGHVLAPESIDGAVEGGAPGAPLAAHA
ncbi:ROK family transcriptional regulator [Nocardioides sambongensis]|uniref:ROK family transcriptional regulator n=1 Tax=Nocardioides sambongensis TaxID=2589074 RepID=UPI00112927B0|nr:ROK family protein [Nocardioides sambongensis]